ncbi:MAG: hypothetical protein JNL23_10145 [Chitinophagaceae bacterium]|nr:hypothetical protein [Chitinophagaceae bacterium]
MLRNDKFVAGLFTIYMLVYVSLLQGEGTRDYAFLMLLFSPLLFACMLFVILKYGKFSGQELGDNEFGYQDKTKDELDVF